MVTTENFQQHGFHPFWCPFPHSHNLLFLDTLITFPWGSMALLLEYDLGNFLKSDCLRSSFLGFICRFVCVGGFLFGVIWGFSSIWKLMRTFKNKIYAFILVKFPTGQSFVILILQLENRERKVNAINPESNMGKLWLYVD